MGSEARISRSLWGARPRQSPGPSPLPLPFPRGLSGAPVLGVEANTAPPPAGLLCAVTCEQDSHRQALRWGVGGEP